MHFNCPCSASESIRAVRFAIGCNSPVNGFIRFSRSGSASCRVLFPSGNYSYVTAVLVTRQTAAGPPQRSLNQPFATRLLGGVDSRKCLSSWRCISLRLIAFVNDLLFRSCRFSAFGVAGDAVNFRWQSYNRFFNRANIFLLLTII